MLYKRNYYQFVCFLIFGFLPVFQEYAFGLGHLNSHSKLDSTDLLVLAGIGEEVLDWVTWEKDAYVITVYPSLSANSRNGLVYGVAPTIKWNSSRPGKANTLTMNAETSTKNILQLQFEHEWYFHPDWMTSGEVFINSREEWYWLGTDENEIYFDRQEFRLKWDLLANVLPAFWVGAEWLLSHNNFDNVAEVIFSEADMVGFKGGWLFGIGPKIEVDTRHRTISPQKGTWIQVTPSFVGLAGLGKYHYFRFTMDARRYFQLKKDKTTLAFQGIIDYAEEGVPFFEEPPLGGKERLRGIGHPLKETGNAVWLFRAELRQHLWWRLGGVVFAGLGESSGNFQSPFSRTISSVGGGLRFRMLPDDPLNVRFDFGVSSSGTTGFFVSLREAF
jgi:outer membrane protein assembly factor BamA